MLFLFVLFFVLFFIFLYLTDHKDFYISETFHIYFGAIKGYTKQEWYQSLEAKA